MADEIKIKVTVDNQTGEGFAKASKSVADGAKQVEESARSSTGALRENASAASAGQGAMSRLGEAFREYRRDERNEGRYVRFFAQQLQELTPISKQAATEIGGVGKVLAAGLGGGVVMLGIEGLKFGMEYVSNKFKEVNAEAKKLADQKFENMVQAANSVKAAADAAFEKLGALHGLTGSFKAEQSAATVAQEWRAASEAHPEWITGTEATAKRQASEERRYRLGSYGLMGAPSLKEADRESSSDLPGTGLSFDLRGMDEEQERFKEKRDKYRESMKQTTERRDAEELLELRKKGEDEGKIQAENQKKFFDQAQKNDKERAAEAEKAARERAAILAKWDKSGLDARGKILADADADMAKLATTDLAARLQVEQVAADRVHKLDEEANAQRSNATLTAETKRLKLVEDFYRREAADKRKLVEDDKKAQLDMQQSNEASMSGMRSFMASTLTDMMHGQLTYKSFIESLWNLIASAIAEAMAKIIVSAIASKLASQGIELSKAQAIIGINSAVTGSEVTSQVAATPAWMAAIPTGTAMALASEGVYGGMAIAAASREGGGVVPGYVREQLNILHPNETVLPADIAVPMRQQLAEGGMGGGTHLHIHATAVDAAGVRKLVNDPSFRRELNQASRNGRL